MSRDSTYLNLSILQTAIIAYFIGSFSSAMSVSAKEDLVSLLLADLHRADLQNVQNRFQHRQQEVKNELAT
jgi:hypothetical protein